jgi:hypothetical protein
MVVELSYLSNKADVVIYSRHDSKHSKIIVAFTLLSSPSTMCGIFAVHGIEKPSQDRARFIALSKRLRHRGPDWSGCFVGKQCVLVHERLAIVGVGERHRLFF